MKINKLKITRYGRDIKDLIGKYLLISRLVPTFGTGLPAVDYY